MKHKKGKIVNTQAPSWLSLPLASRGHTQLHLPRLRSPCRCCHRRHLRPVVAAAEKGITGRTYFMKEGESEANSFTTTPSSRHRSSPSPVWAAAHGAPPIAARRSSVVEPPHTELLLRQANRSI